MSGIILLQESPTDMDVQLIKVFKDSFSEELKKFNNGKDYDSNDGLALLKKYLETVPAEKLQKKLELISINAWIPVAESLYFFNITLFCLLFCKTFFPFS